MNSSGKTADLRHFLAQYRLPAHRPALPLGAPEADHALGGGLATGALHEVHALDWGAGGFAALLAVLAAERADAPLFWVRPDYEALEYGGLYASGLLELGGRPDRLFLVRTADAADALTAAQDILACPHVGAVLLELNGHPKALDLVAQRRLAFTAAASGVTPILLRTGARTLPSPAQTRWHVASAPSDESVLDEDWGWPSFAVHLSRNRLGNTGRWTLQWRPETRCFSAPDAAAHQHVPAAYRRQA